MTREDIIKAIKDRFSEDIIDVFEKSTNRVFISIRDEALVRICEHVFKEMKARFNIASATDLRCDIEILYHFTFEDVNLMVSFRVTLPKDKPEIDSLANSFKAANWIEREINEMLGITFRGHPDMRRLLLPDDWPEGVYPLRADYEEWDKKAIRDRGV